jgi:hypothetical protein
VKRNTSILKKQIIASLLLAVFVSIQITKAVHTHDSTDCSSLFSAKVQVQKSNDCSVCDYHFTKDTFLHTSFLETQPKVYVNRYYNSYQSRVTSSIGLTYTDRGPPVIA